MGLFSGQVVLGDNLDVLGGVPDGLADLVYADPPFGTGRDFGEFDDRWEDLDGYLDYMRPRLVECRRVVADAGSFWLHCDPRVSHYLKVMCDDIFGRRWFRNEVVWWYYNVPINEQGRFGWKHDVLLYYAGEGRVFRQVRVPYQAGMSGFDRFRHPDGRRLGDVWPVPSINNMAEERVGYPTQKPLALLERIIMCSSREDSLVADPFCGSGTALVAAKRLGRRWFGCDISGEAVRVARERLGATGGPLPGLAG